MKVSTFHIFTLKDAPADDEIISHKLMIQSGMIRKLSSGQYSWLPIGLKVISKIEKQNRKVFYQNSNVENNQYDTVKND